MVCDFSPSKRHARTYYEYPASPLTTAGARDGHHRWSLEREIEGDAREGELSWRSGERRREAEQPRAATLEDGDREWEMWRSGSIFDSTRLDAAVRRRRRRGIDRRAPLLSLPFPSPTLAWLLPNCFFFSSGYSISLSLSNGLYNSKTKKLITRAA